MNQKMKLKVGPLTYTIKYTNGDKLALEPEWVSEDDGGEYYGAVENKTQTIFLRKQNSEERERLALLHEVIHAVNDIYDTQLVEGQVKCLSAGLMDTLNRNKWFREKMCQN